MEVNPLGNPDAFDVNVYEQLELNDPIISVIDWPSTIVWFAFPDVIDPETEQFVATADEIAITPVTEATTLELDNSWA